ncbi:tRNA 2-thiouridine synthesizing protein E [Pseudomonas sp. SJZ103]|jgi:tRNA 2-thiouridine synthesizing protein E|uniref:TusE/DsrC/DsvC family sulfur relay protein n=1 Tax=unclassified Pseudomonas TaxID=196821 RepID=UPI0010398D2F|nr:MULTISPECIES: TusE/DsrC/DsvC family sulfur relay protein [unclassified Pseudomonas]MBB6286717.1 tRNA 2-thiouridine synthesizing protein E [Pseudomonas sp. SJZ073]MBB6311358.1 tRNA 2-thiouridine synthesizing protein E [Pseudomonas sp. JAI120]NJJ57535.1 TusE/DsrC/DsvC family sulfur relay protein [Pseudomonas sp. B14(2022)]TWC65562.1 tRNA 2-thiouridine synthesizing protein E [Pseudomonas sp. SJZ103]TWC82276.1 tRNA 2-thiouridine synthesizing protein E [Pseudomonas sp. SJZ094]
MNTLTVGARTLDLDKDGYLVDLNEWSPEVANALAAAEGLELTPDHWQILELLRQFYAEFQLSPATRPLIKYTALKLGPQKGNSLHLNTLFNGTPAKLAAKLAGLPRPTNCL